MDHIDFDLKYEPKSLTEVLYSDPPTASSILAYAKNATRRHLLLFGPPGSGKSTIAKLIPNAIVPDLQKPDILLVNGSAERTMTVVEKIRTFCSYNSPFNSAGMRFVIINEAERLTALSQDALRDIMDKWRGQVPFVMTTNHFDQMAAALRSRCEKILIDYVPVEVWLPRAKDILAAEGVTGVTDDVLLPLISAGAGDNREILGVLQKLAYEVRDASSKIIPMPKVSV